MVPFRPNDPGRISRDLYRERRSAALAEWRGLLFERGILPRDSAAWKAAEIRKKRVRHMRTYTHWRCDTSSAETFTGKDAQPPWLSGAPLRPEVRLGLGSLRQVETGCRWTDSTTNNPAFRPS